MVDAQYSVKIHRQRLLKLAEDAQPRLNSKIKILSDHLSSRPDEDLDESQMNLRATQAASLASSRKLLHTIKMLPRTLEHASHEVIVVSNSLLEELIILTEPHSK